MTLLMESESKLIIQDYECLLSTNYNKAKIHAFVNTKHNSINTSISIYLQCYVENWRIIKYWITDYNNANEILDFECDIIHGYRYRVIVNYYAEKDDKIHWISDIIYSSNELD